MQNGIQYISTNFAQLAAKNVDATQIADLAVSTWQAIAAALSPILGQRGVASLYQRSLYLTRKEYAWLETLYESALQTDEFVALWTALAQQTSSNAATANSALLQNFYNLLINLIGESLTARLLSSVLDNSSSNHTAQDTLP
ncbi:MAG: hypothetical protein ACYCSS_13580 [Sulfuriferula sp.]